MALTNLNTATATKTFPALNITDYEARTRSWPIAGNPGYVMEMPDGSWVWTQTEQEALTLAGNTGAVYHAADVHPYWGTFKAANFNPATAYTTFPPLNITEDEARAQSSPTVGDAGWVVEQPDGSWKWVPNLPQARAVAGQTGAIYPAMDLTEYWRGFAREAKIDPKTGEETLLGSVPPIE